MIMFAKFLRKIMKDLNGELPLAPLIERGIGMKSKSSLKASP
jgi:hypothetical protein